MSGGILSGIEIQAAAKRGEIRIDPFDPNHVNFGDRMNPASYDLTLGRKVAVYSAVTRGDFAPPMPNLPPGYNLYPGSGWLDAAKKNEVTEYEMEGDSPLYLRPGVGYLMHTEECITTDRYVPIIDGKSSIGRLFAFIHVTAGYGDPGFNGQYTLEVTVVHPLLVYPGMRFCQMRFHTIVGDVESYKKKGNYQGELARGPIPSQSHKMFAKP